VRFLDPLLLLGLLAVGIPLVIHLLDRRNPPRVPFAAVEFILRSQRKRAHRFRIRQLLLLLARMLLLAGLAFAFARPQWLTEAPSLAAAGPPTATVVVLDDSLSLQLRVDGEEPLFERARELAAEVFAGQRPEDSGGIVRASTPLGPPLVASSFDRRALSEALAEVQVGYGGTDLAGAIAQAAALLSASPLPRKRIVVVSDLQAAGFDPARLPTLGAEAEVELVLVPVVPPEAPGNRAVTAVELTPASEQGPLAFRIVATVAGFGTLASGEVELQLEVDGQSVNAGVVRLEGGRGSKEFVHRFATPGLHHGLVRLPPDALAADDRRHFALEVQRQIRVLLVNGDPRSTAQQDELFYLERALQPGAEQLSRLAPTVLSVPLLAGAPLDEYDVVVLANVSGLGADGVAELERFVRRGGGLLVAAGDNVETARYNAELLPLLPRALRGVQRLTPAGGSEAQGLGTLRGGSPVVAPLLGAAGEGLRAARFWSWLLLEPGASEGELLVHLALSSGAPILVERPLGRGRVALLTTTLDRDWTDLAIRTGYLPLVQELLLRLADAQQSGIQQPVLVAAPFTVPRPGWVQQVTLQPPGRRPRTLDAAELPERRELEVTDGDRPGIYRVLLTGGPDGPVQAKDQAVVTDPAESDPRLLSEAELTALARAPGTEAGARPASSLRPIDLWPWALLLLLALLLGEALLLLRRDNLGEELATSAPRTPQDGRGWTGRPAPGVDRAPGAG